MTNETNKTLTIKPPEGYEIDQENSTFECIKFKELPQKSYHKRWSDLGYLDGYYVNADSSVDEASGSSIHIENKNICRTEEQANGLLALSELSQFYYDFTKDDSSKHEVYISISNTSSNVYILETKERFLSFKDQDTADIFNDLHIDLLRQASVWY